MLDPIYTNGVIAVKEKFLMGDKLLRFTEMSAEEVLRAVAESGFGSGAQSQDGESLCQAEELALDGFIREYAPSRAELVYLLSFRDFHNAKAVCKAHKLNSSAEKMFAPDGLTPVSEISSAVAAEKTDELPKELRAPLRAVLDSEKELSGAEIGALFDAAAFEYVAESCKFNPLLKKLLAGRADRTNILTAVRSSDADFAEKLYVGGGKLKNEKLRVLFKDTDSIVEAFEKTPYLEFVKLCLTAKEKGMPFTDGERALESVEAEYFKARRFELEGRQPFLYYVFRRRAEIQNVRIILVCLNAGLAPQDIRRRLRAI